MMNKMLTLLLLALNGIQCLPFRTYAPRSVPGRIKESSDPLSIRDYFTNYFATMRQHQQPQYGLPEYEPSYLDNFLYRNRQLSPETAAAILPYVQQSNSRDYSYDYAAPTTSFTDEDVWYDDPEANEYASIVDKYNQNAALLQLFLDHLQGKYSLEDLETLEREAAIEANNENQLQSLMAKKKSTLPLMSLSSPRRIQFRQGQKEEALMLPSTSLRKPIFTTNLPEKKKAKSKKEANKKKLEKNKKEQTTPKPMEIKEKTSSTMEPYVKTAYESLRRYLDKERIRKQNDDESLHNSVHQAQKRFVSDPQSLTEQLSGLKKTHA